MRCHSSINGYLDPSWQEWFEDLKILHKTDGRTVLHELLVGQAALYRVLLKIHSLGLVLLSLETEEQDQ
ncbi:hypothetical protein KSC_043980 [Ktedonobacter sp. SOSP1-52]|uniref:hypothetical protein n=1 Tax=Ktedonobacter sp. SOSP1-52 TaxID=2778366 RepID=UPI001916824F|nr:hypothetical protein [Ktedonobacter sp. SOSP1-52]GHO65506.1 hypothetical protein KSC_043980 [Ktedonobacter sp. SOSP1-52]